MANKSIPEITESTSLQTTDLIYVGKRKSQGGFVDRKAELFVFRTFVNTSRTVEKSGSYTIPASLCDKRWFSNRDATGSITFYLPAAVDGYQVGIFLEESQAVIVIPKSTDKILPSGVSDGVGLTASAAGASLYLRGYSDGWHIMSEIGTWTTSP